MHTHDMHTTCTPQYMKSLTVRAYEPGENIILEGDNGGDMYIVVATEKIADYAEVEVIQYKPATVEV